MFTFSPDTLKGDKFAQVQFKDFFQEFVDKFCSKFLLKDRVLEDLVGSHINRLKDFQYELVCSSSESYTIQQCMDKCREMADFTNKHLEGIDINNFVEHYMLEWKGGIDDKVLVHISQYNSMMLRDTLKHVIKVFVRDQIYQTYKVAVDLHHREKGSTVYMTCKSGIEQFGLYDPNPRFADEDEDEDEEISRGMSPKQAARGRGYLTTDQPDIAILAPILDKYKVIRFNLETGISQYGGMTSDRILEALCSLKYLHLNLGEAPRRRVLDLGGRDRYSQKGGRIVHIDSLVDKDVTGSRNY